MDLWKELHLRALNFAGDNDIQFLTDFAKKIPRYTSGCKCKEHWMGLVQRNPPKFGKDEYFAWTVNMHNEISKLIGKPTYTVEQSKLFYSKK